MINSSDITYLGAFVAGLLSFLSPCVLPLIPSYITYITGLSFADLQREHPGRKVRRQTVLHSLAFVVGFTVVFVVLGASATLAGALLLEHMVTVRKIGGILVFLFGLHITGLVPIKWLLGEKRINLRHKPAGYVGSLVVGMVFAAGWTPCIGPILGSILALAATEEDVGKGIRLLLAYSCGMGLPFLLASLTLHRFIMFFNQFKKYIRMFEIITGILLMIVGVMIYANWLSRLSGYAVIFWGGY